MTRPENNHRPVAGEDRAEDRAQRRAREAAERAEWSALIARLGVLNPKYDCFCGSLQDLREAVARLEREHAGGKRDRNRQASTSSGGGRQAGPRAAATEDAEQRRAVLNRLHSQDRAADTAGQDHGRNDAAGWSW